MKLKKIATIGLALGVIASSSMPITSHAAEIKTKKVCKQTNTGQVCTVLVCLHTFESILFKC